MKRCVFVGPSAGTLAVSPNIDRYSPASLGSIFQAVQLGYQRIGLVDGLFGTVPSVWHKEILYAMACGVEVSGASSMGALRAAELHEAGMIGIGKIFRYYRAGMIMDDDEVCLTHGVLEVGFTPVSSPMINIRLTLSRLEKEKLISPKERLLIINHLKQRHFSERNVKDAVTQLAGVFSDARAKDLVRLYDDFFIDQKHLDYTLLIKHLMRAGGSQGESNLDWSKIVTKKWSPQFEIALSDIPKLEMW